MGVNLRTAAVDGFSMQVTPARIFQMRVHARAIPGASVQGARHGMISLRQERSGIAKMLYRYLCLTSHFGCGHIEVAFYELGDDVTVYGIRNIARANAQRMGLAATAKKLSIQGTDESQAVLFALYRFLAKQGVRSQLASPEDCVALTVSQRLLKPGSQDATLCAMLKKYKSLYQVALDFVADSSLVSRRSGSRM